MECIACSGLKYAECNEKKRDKAEVELYFGMNGGCINTEGVPAEKIALEKTKKIMGHLCQNGVCNVHNAMRALVHSLSEYAGGLKTANITGASVIVSGTSYTNAYALIEDVPPHQLKLEGVTLPQGQSMMCVLKPLHRSNPDRTHTLTAAAARLHCACPTATARQQCRSVARFQVLRAVATLPIHRILD